MRLYLAGPLFTIAEREFNRRLKRELCRYGHECFLPQENEQGDDPSKIFESDVAGIDWCETVVACMDGPDPDSGTCWETGYAYGKRRVVLYRTDFRIEAGPCGPFNLMMTQAADAVVLARMDEPVEALARKIHLELEKLEPLRPTIAEGPATHPHVRVRDSWDSWGPALTDDRDYCPVCGGPCKRRPRHGDGMNL